MKVGDIYINKHNPQYTYKIYKLANNKIYFETYSKDQFIGKFENNTTNFNIVCRKLTKLEKALT